MCVLSCFSRVRLFVTPWTVAHQAPLSVGFSRQEYWSGLPFPSPGNLPNPESEPASLTSHALARRFFTTSAHCCMYIVSKFNSLLKSYPWLPWCSFLHGWDGWAGWRRTQESRNTGWAESDPGAGDTPIPHCPDMLGCIFPTQVFRLCLHTRLSIKKSIVSFCII